jgi:hypothetical protein
MAEMTVFYVASNIAQQKWHLASLPLQAHIPTLFSVRKPCPCLISTSTQLARYLELGRGSKRDNAC